MDETEEELLVSLAAGRLVSAQYTVDVSGIRVRPELQRPIDLELGDHLRAHAERVRDATHSSEVADELAELTAAGNGLLPALAEILYATADFWQDLGDGADYHYAQRLRYLADHHLQAVSGRPGGYAQ